MNIPKFRAWDKENKKWTNYQICDDIVLFYKKHTGAWKRDDKREKFELMQSTGLKDKSGAEIFEGDIFTHKNNHKFVVKWDEDRFVGLDNKRNGDGYCCYISSCDKSGNSTIEVIGNIYENPELLKEGAK